MKMITIPSLLVVMLVGCAPDSGWKHETALDSGGKLGGCAVGDLDSARSGNEIGVVAEDGTVTLVYRDGSKWGSEKIGAASGEMIQCAIGDVDPERPGNELVAVGMKTGGEEDGGAGAAMVASKENGAWKLEPLFEDTALIHGVCVGDLDPDLPGNEILLVGFSLDATLAHREAGEWKTAKVATLPGAGKSAVPFEGGAAVTCADGSVVHLVKRDGAWTSTTLDKAEAGQSRVGTDDSRLIVARDDGVLSLLQDGKRTEIHKEELKLRGAVLADVTPSSKGAEAATAGYGKSVTVLWQERGEWHEQTVFTDTGKLHHLAAGQFEGMGPSACLVTCGFSGLVTVISHQ
ncbi:MAG: hypothetical protein V2A76_07100 [Planctomycetota bacterium]